MIGQQLPDACAQQSLTDGSSEYWPSGYRCSGFCRTVTARATIQTRELAHEGRFQAVNI